MPRPLRLEIENGFYHVTVRGNQKQTIFWNDDDHERFIAQLQHTLKSYQVILYAYVLMKNHFHLLIKTPLGNLSRFMQRLNTSYSMYYRFNHNRPGHCFQGRFGAKIIQNDTYLKTLSRYIHLNPVKISKMNKLPRKKKIQYLKEYKWSSLPGYLNKNMAEDFICYDILSAFSRDEKKSRAMYETFIYESIENTLPEDKNLTSRSSLAIGDESYITIIEDEIKDKAKGNYDYFIPKSKNISIEIIERKVCESFGIKKSELRQHGRIAGVAKEIVIELSSRYTGLSMREVGKHYGVSSASGVGSIRKRFIEKNIEKTKQFKVLETYMNEKINKCKV